MTSTSIENTSRLMSAGNLWNAESSFDSGFDAGFDAGFDVVCDAVLDALINALSKASDPKRMTAPPTPVTTSIMVAARLSIAKLTSMLVDSRDIHRHVFQTSLVFGAAVPSTNPCVSWRNLRWRKANAAMAAMKDPKAVDRAMKRVASRPSLVPPMAHTMAPRSGSPRITAMSAKSDSGFGNRDCRNSIGGSFGHMVFRLNSFVGDHISLGCACRAVEVWVRDRGFGRLYLTPVSDVSIWRRAMRAGVLIG
ncbi:MAG: hypothetical protein FWD57_09430 [Polyangiaceae bacterium]|nr:hypothetical protein [Polyangiaceae bacterium]